MTDNEREVLEALRERLLRLRARREGDGAHYRGWMTPTQIGVACGKIHYNASTWACRYLKRLRDRELVCREPPGVCAITEAGIAALEEK